MSSRRWCFTLNNYTLYDPDEIKAWDCKYVVAGKELGESGTPHLQGFVVFGSMKRLSALKKLCMRSHWEVAKADSPHAAAYCKKGEQSHEEWALHGIKGPNYGKNADFFEVGSIPSKGKRSDLAEVKEAIENGMTNLRDIRRSFPDVYSRHTRWVKEFVLDNQQLIDPPNHPLREWQQALLEKLKKEPDGRTVHVVIDYKGNEGKSWFAKRYRYDNQDSTIILKPGPYKDMAYSLATSGITPRVVIMDVPRFRGGEKDALRYDFLEDLLDGELEVVKYESFHYAFKPPHVVIFTNHDIDMSAYSEDRLDIVRLNHESNPLPGYYPDF